MRSLRIRLISRREGGQAAVAFVVLMALVLVLAASTMNVGEVARLRTSTANAADAGALAAASWVASGENEAAAIAQAMFNLIVLISAIFAIPFCYAAACAHGVALAVALITANQQLKATADQVLHAAWDNAKSAALFTAIQNLQIDDQSGQVQRRVREITEQFEANQQLPPMPVVLSWQRRGGDGVMRPNSVAINVEFLNGRPALETGGFGPVGWCLSECFIPAGCGPPCCICVPTTHGPQCVWPCWTPFLAWGGPGEAPPDLEPDHVPNLLEPDPVGLGGGAWVSLGRFIRFPRPASGCRTCIPYPLPVPGALAANPSGVHNWTGRIRVTVTQHRAGGSNLGFWTTRYPDHIVSSATATYFGSDGPRDASAKAKLVEVF